MKPLPQPFVKWVGSKRQILEELLKYVPEKFKMYHEPMVGGGAFFWGLVRRGLVDGHRVALGDTNAALMETYRAVRDSPEPIIRELEHLADVYRKGGEDLYYRIRDAWNEGYTSPARFIFLKQTSFNGLWRHNRSGRINMPWGHYDSPKILDVENIRACSQALRGVKAWTTTFYAYTDMMTKGDFVYFDPPYWGCFDLYGPEGFTEHHHIELIRACAELTERGVYVLYTNEESKPVIELLEQYWPGCSAQVVQSRRYVNSDGSGRQPVSDLIVSGRVIAG